MCDYGMGLIATQDFNYCELEKGKVRINQLGLGRIAKLEIIESSESVTISSLDYIT